MNRKMRFGMMILLACFSAGMAAKAQPGTSVNSTRPSVESRLKISGVYPHLAVYNEGGSNACEIRDPNKYDKKSEGREVGIGAVIPWAGKLWMITYSPHCPFGSSDKLYSISDDLVQMIHPESQGGTPANRMIHRESKQLITSSYFIDTAGNVRNIPFSVMPGRMTATARHLSDPVNKVYFYDMEGMVYEVNVNSLEVKKLFHKPVPGWHGKGAYTAQRRFIVANNGEEAVFKLNPKELKAGALPKNKDEMGVLASWDGRKWSIIERKQFTDITGPGGIYGSLNDKSPAWSIGWDKRSVILKLLDQGTWYTYRLPKATHSYDHRGGWYTEWPRIREVGKGKMLMDMHGIFYDFPKTFSRINSAGISPLSTHLRYVPDFCEWNGQLVLATDETSLLENPMAGRSQSNLWFGEWSDLRQWGRASGWGGPWLNDSVRAGVASDPFLFNGFEEGMLHLAHQSGRNVAFSIELDKAGNNRWTTWKTITVGANGYAYEIFPPGLKAQWVRVKTNRDAVATAFFYQAGSHRVSSGDNIFTALADANDQSVFEASLIRPAGHNKNLQVLPLQTHTYLEADENLKFVKPGYDTSATEATSILALNKDFEIDELSVIVKDKTGTFRLPKGNPVFDHPLNETWPRGRRELESERLMLNAHGSFYEVGREAGYIAMRPVTTHNKKIMDFCTWKGLLVLSGTRNNATADGHYFPFGSEPGGLWFGAIDDLWKLGKPVGRGSVWKESAVKAGEASLPFLMTGYDRKKVILHSDKTVSITLQVDVDLHGWHNFKTFTLKRGQTLEYTFPAGYQAHWVRALADKDCQATVSFIYE